MKFCEWLAKEIPFWVVAVVYLVSVGEAQSEANSCQAFFQLAKSSEPLGTVQELSAKNFVFALNAIYPNDIDPNALVFGESSIDDPEAFSIVTCIDDLLFFNEVVRVNILNLKTKQFAHSKALGLVVGAWKITDDVYALELHNTKFSAYGVVNIKTGKVLLEPKMDTFSSPQKIGLIIENKLLFQEDIIPAPLLEGQANPVSYTYVLGFYKVVENALIQEASCQYESSDSFFPEHYALSQEGLIVYQQEVGKEFYHLRVLSECKELADLLRE